MMRWLIVEVYRSRYIVSWIIVLTSNLDRNTRKYVIVSCILLFFSIVGLCFL